MPFCFTILINFGSFRGLSESDVTAFRECYGRLGELKAYLKGVPFVCMSATAPESVIASVSKSLQLVTPNLVKVQVKVQNIWYDYSLVSDKTIGI